MGGSQSTPSRPSSPTHGDHASRPPASRRLSSFGRLSSRSTRRKSSYLATPPSSTAIDSSPTLSEVHDVSPPLSASRGVEVDDEAPDIPLVKPTPSLPTAPGPPVAFPTAVGLGTSHFLPPPSPSLPIAPYLQPDAAAALASSEHAGPSRTPTPPAPTPSPFRPSHNRNLSLPNPASPSDRTMSGTLTALLGVSGPGDLDPSHPLGGPSTGSPLAEEHTGEVGSDADDQDDTESDDSYDAQAVSDEIAEEEEAIRIEREAIRIEREAIDGEMASISAERSELRELQTRLDTAREELARSRAELESMQERRAARNRVPVGAMLVIQGLAQTRITSSTLGEAAREGASGAAAAAGPSVAGGSTSEVNSASVAGPSERAGTPMPPATSALAPRRPNMGRRISDGSLFRRRREAEQERGASLEQQARMISGLLTVAAAATANTLLAVPEEPSPTSPPRTGLTGAIQSLLNRLRPARAPQHGIEQALGQYLQNVVRDARRPGTSAPPGALPGASLPPLPIPESQGGAEAGSEFQAFLRGLEGDLVGAVRAYAGSVGSDDWAAELEGARSAEQGETGRESPAESEGTWTVSESGASTASQVGEGEGEGDEEDRVAEAVSEAEIPVALPSETPAALPEAIPTFHPQLGQNISSGPRSQSDRYGVSGGQNGEPRQLNFFRAHLFPPITSSPPPAAAAGVEGTASSAREGASPAGVPSTTVAAPDDPNAIVPCIFVGVRSIQRDADGANPEDVFNSSDLFGAQAGTPTAPTTTPPAPSDPSLPSSPTPSAPVAAADSTRPPLTRVRSPSLSSTAPSAPRTFRERFLSRLSRRTPPLAPSHPVNTYLVYVIGGNYPANHPILRIPALLTGAPLSDEDMALISELMGPAKAPTATKEDIERAGLKLVDGSEMAELGTKGEVMDNCTERCLICLGDYEEGEECRVLACKHGYHKACVDQWLEKGSNSCPACRTEAVEVNKGAPLMSANPAEEALPSLTEPIPVLSVPAGPSGPSLDEDLD